MPTELFRTVCPGNFNFKDQRCACILNRISVWLYEKLDNVTVMSNWINVRIVHVTVWFVQETLYFFTDKEAKVNHSLCLLRVMKSFFLMLQGNVCFWSVHLLDFFPITILIVGHHHSTAIVHHTCWSLLQRKLHSQIHLYQLGISELHWNAGKDPHNQAFVSVAPGNQNWEEHEK